MAYFKQFPVTDESDGRRVCGRARAVGRRCTRTLVALGKNALFLPTLLAGIKLSPNGTIGPNAIAPQEVARIIQRVDDLLNAEADATAPVWPIEHLAAHSTRIGAAHDLAASGIDLTSIMHSGGWTDPKMPRYYTRELAALESGMARMMRARKEPSTNG